jgi:hypothetical protein
MKRETKVNYGTLVSEIMVNDGWQGMYRGLVPMILRDVPAWSAYFWAYAYLKYVTGLDERG